MTMDMDDGEGVDCGREGWAGGRKAKGAFLYNCNRINKNNNKKKDTRRKKLSG